MKKIVIIGGGFAGSYCAKNLEKDFDVTLIDTKKSIVLLAIFYSGLFTNPPST